MIPATLGRYRILGELGRGAMGTVYHALDPLIEREVAVKTLNPGLPQDVIDEVRERFLREAKAAGQLNHPNIVTIFDAGEQDGIAYMAMELLEGRSLQQILIETPRLPFETAAHLIAQIAEALDRAQQLGIVHRDVKPANVVVSASGHAKLADFGVAYVPASTMTQIGTLIGSPRYMSPEQVLGLPVDPRADIFSLGVVLYEMLVGRPPFVRPEDTEIFELSRRIASEPHPPVTQLDPSIPAAFEVILDKALAKKPEDRYQRAGEMANDLRKLSGPEPSRSARAQADDERTVVLAPGPAIGQPQFEKTVPTPAGAQAASTPSRELETTNRTFVADLETFARNFEMEEQARLRAEEDARRRRKEDLELWSEAERLKWEAFERQQSTGSQGSGATSGARTGSNRGALQVLKKQAESRLPADDGMAKKSKADADLDRSMRAALQYLAEVARELNGVNPTAGRPYDYVFLGRLPAARLSDAFVDLRSRKINERDYGEQLFFRFSVQPTAPATAILLGAEIARCQEYFDARRIPFEVGSEATNDFGQARRAAFTVSARLPCEVNIRANYDDGSVEIELVNVRLPGRVFCRLMPSKLDEVVDDLARYILGADDEFTKLLRRD